METTSDTSTRLERARTIASQAAELSEAFRNVPSKSCVEAFLGREAAGPELMQAQVDYTALCCATQADGPLPYESVYVHGERLLDGDCVDEVMLAYQLAGYEAPADMSREPQDHLAIELDFACFAYTCALNSADNADGLLAFADSFKESHIDSWVASYAAEGERVADGACYRIVLERLRGFAEL